MTDPTPTRDEAVPTGWKLVPVEPTEAMMAIGRTCGTNSANTYAAMLASAPAPASGGVHAVREALLGYVLKPGQYETASVFARGQNRVAVDMLGVLDEASLSPAATPVSEAETVAWQTVSDFVDEMLRDWSGGDDCRMGFGVNGATVTKGQFRAVRSALASLSPAATPVSEAGGEVDWLVEHLLSWPCTGDERDGKSEAYINGLMRQAARRIEALTNPASSPAGGDVVQTLIDKTEKLIEAADDMGWSCNSSSADQAIREAKDAVRAALSQSTSPEANPTASGETVGSFRDRGPVATNPPGRGGPNKNSTSEEVGE